MFRSIGLLFGCLVSVVPCEYLYSQEPTYTVDQIRAAQENWVNGFSGIRVRWRQWYAGGLHQTDPTLPSNTLLKDSPRYTLEEFCWSDLGKLTVSQSGVVNNIPKSLYMHGTNGTQPWDAETVPGKIDKWTLVKLMRNDTAHPQKTNITIIAMHGLWDCSPGQWFSQRLASREDTTIEVLQNEQIDEIACVVVQSIFSDEKSETTVREKSWLDASLEFLPRKFETTVTTPKVSYFLRWSADEFELVDGKPFPKHGQYHSTGLTEPGFEWYVELIEFSPDFSIADFEPRMSPGTRVINYDRGYVGQVAEDGQTILGATPEEDSVATAVPTAAQASQQGDSVMEKDGIAEPGKSNWWLITIVCGVIMSSGMVWKYVRSSSK